MERRGDEEVGRGSHPQPARKMLKKGRKAYRFPIPNSQFGNLKAVWQYSKERKPCKAM
ncbi:hypothetical protein QUA44_23030 [Microcoleus sp. N9_A2]|uniref:hypothetical protein n=1 Tax=unclassified Microcoleus TaxID=2642155 RepID=UPI002FD62E09